MGLVIKISFYYKWEQTYFVQSLNTDEARKKAFKMFKESMGCTLPDTLDEAEKDESFSIEIITKIEQIIL